MESDVAYAIEAANNTWYLIDAAGKALDKISATAAKAYPRITGVKIAAPELGAQVSAVEPETPETTEATQTQQTEAAIPVVTVTESERLLWVLTILKNLEKAGFVGDIRLQRGLC